MRAYSLPVDLRQEEKIIGGYLSARQSGYLVAGAVLAALIYFAVPFPPLAVVIAVLPVAAAGVLAFASIGSERADRYLVLLSDRRPRQFYYHRRTPPTEPSPGRILGVAAGNERSEKRKAQKCKGPKK